MLRAMRVVLDTDVMVAAIRSDTGASRQLLIAALRRAYALLLSVPLAFEYEAVMSRADHLMASRLTAVDVQDLLDAVIMVAEQVRISFLWRPRLRDPNDDMVLETAVNGGADLLVTFNRRDFEAASPLFSITVCSPRDALKVMELKQ